VIAVVAAAAVAGGALSYGWFGVWRSAENDVTFASPKEAYNAGATALSENDFETGLPALQYAARHGVFAARLRLARFYAKDGTGHRNDAKALVYYQTLTNQYSDIDRLHPSARFVSEAFLAVARYYREGVPEIGLTPQPRKAAELLRHAASYFRDPRAQFKLGKMYARGHGVAPSRRLAIRWLFKASQKKYAPAQAFLGEMLWQATGDEGAARAQGLALLALAVDNARAEERGDIQARYRQAGRDARSGEIERAERLVAKWDSLRAGTAETSVIAQLSARRYLQFSDGLSGSLVVAPDHIETAVPPKFAAAGDRKDAPLLSTQPTMPSVYRGDAKDVFDSPDAATSISAEKFFLAQPGLGGGDTSSDMFSAIEVDRYGGETLSTSTASPFHSASAGTEQAK